MKRRPQTKGVCRWCDKAVLSPKGEPTTGTWHSECVDAYKLLFWPAVTREAVFERDRGICALCGCNAHRQHARFMRVRGYDPRHPYPSSIRPDYMRWGLPRGDANGYATPQDRQRQDRIWRSMEVRYAKRKDRLAAAARERFCEMVAQGWHEHGGGWQADHIRPLCEADGDLSFWELPNLRTLCTPCHKAKTREDVARLATRRRELREAKNRTERLHVAPELFTAP